MQKQYIEFKIEHQTITRTDTFNVVGGSRNYLYARFTFSEEWAEQLPVAFFYSSRGKTYSQEIVNGECLVPWEALMGRYFCVSCEGGSLITTDDARVDVNPGGAGGRAIWSQPPTPSAYDQLAERFKTDSIAAVKEQAVLFGEPQELTAEERAQARENIFTDDDALAALIDADMLPAIHNPDSAILTDENGNVILRY